MNQINIALILFIALFVLLFTMLTTGIGQQKPAYVFSWKIWWTGLVTILVFSVLAFLAGKGLS
jgi:hypothetical protein